MFKTKVTNYEKRYFKQGKMGKVQIVNDSKCEKVVPFTDRNRDYVVQMCTQ